MQLSQQVLLKESIVNIINNTNLKKIKLINIYKYSYNKNSKINFFSKAVPKKFKKHKYKEYVKKKKILNLIVRTKQWTNRNDGSYRKFNENSVLLLNKKLNSLNNNIYGPTLLELYRKKYFYLFKYIFICLIQKFDYIIII